MKNAWKKQLAKLRPPNHPYLDRFRWKELKAKWDFDKFVKSKSVLESMFYVGWMRQDGSEGYQGRDEFFWPLYLNARFNRELTKFMFSFRSQQSTNRNINNLMFITGPHNSGKSWFLRYNLQKFENAGTEIPPILIDIDLNRWNCLNFDNFLEIFENTTIDYLAKRSSETFKDHQLLTPQMCLDALLFNRDKLYLELKLRELLEKKQGDLRHLLGHQRKFRETWLLDNWDKVAEAAGGVEGTLQLIKELLVLEEHSEAPPAYTNSLYRTGIRVSAYLFDVLNLIGGYHQLSEGEDFPHVCVVLEAAQKLLNLETCEDRAFSWIEHICVRFYVSSK